MQGACRGPGPLVRGRGRPLAGHRLRRRGRAVAYPTPSPRLQTVTSTAVSGRARTNFPTCRRLVQAVLAIRSRRIAGSRGDRSGVGQSPGGAQERAAGRRVGPAPHEPFPQRGAHPQALAVLVDDDIRMKGDLFAPRPERPVDHDLAEAVFPGRPDPLEGRALVGHVSVGGKGGFARRQRVLVPRRSRSSTPPSSTVDRFRSRWRPRWPRRAPGGRPRPGRTSSRRVGHGLPGARRGRPGLRPALGPAGHRDAPGRRPGAPTLVRRRPEGRSPSGKRVRRRSMPSTSRW